MKRRRAVLGKCTAVAAILLIALIQVHMSANALRGEEVPSRKPLPVVKRGSGKSLRQGQKANSMVKNSFVERVSDGIEEEEGAASNTTASKRRASESSTFYSDSNEEEQRDADGYDSIRSSNRQCPYVIHSEEEARARAVNASIPGNIVTVTHLRFCRTGNHFSSVFRNLALGYCCKSKLVWLPPKDDILAPGIFNEGTPGPRWFDFSTAPDLEGFESLSCKAHITWAGQRAFRMDQLDTPGHSHYNPKLRECIKNAPRLVGCEAVYYFPADIDVCTSEKLTEGGRTTRTAEHGGRRRGMSNDEHVEGAREETNTDGVRNEYRREGDGEERSEGAEVDDSDDGEKGMGKLVLHVRSGDIFDNDILSYYGQPPLQFYLHVIQDQNWDRVDVVTNGEDSQTLNPVVPALQARRDSGELPENVHIHTNRSLDDDLQAMMCADALGMARSTVATLTSFHSTASRIYGPVECNRQLNQLAKVRPEAQVYGLSWPRQYSVYEKWENTPDQREEMLAYNNITGLLQCMG